MEDIIKEIQKSEEPDLLLNTILAEIGNQVKKATKDNVVNVNQVNYNLKEYGNELISNTYDDIFVGSLFGFVYEKTLEAKRNNNDFFFEIETYFLNMYGSLRKEKLRKYFFTESMLNDNTKALNVIESIPTFVDEEYKNLKPRKLKTLLTNVCIVLSFLGYYPKDLLVKCGKEHNKKFIECLQSIISLP